MKKFFEEFKAFAMRGNVIDLAVGMIIGSAFGKITSSLVNDVIMPAVSMLMGGVDFTAWKLVLKGRWLCVLRSAFPGYLRAQTGLARNF